MLEEETFDTSDRKEVLKIMKHLADHKVPAEEHKTLSGLPKRSVIVYPRPAERLRYCRWSSQPP